MPARSLLATAVSVWVTAALGVACGLGAWRLIVLSIIAVALILVVASKIDHALYGKFGREDDQ
jgi:putative Mg2+ transporter-C (MgtC) family protein